MDECGAIRQLTYRYAFCVDTANVNEMTRLWIDDAVLDLSAVGLNDCHGMDAIRAFFQHTADTVATSAHYATNHVISLEGDQATGRCYFLMFGRKSGEDIESTRYYDDVYQRVGPAWHLARRRVVPLNAPKLTGLEPAPERRHAW